MIAPKFILLSLAAVASAAPFMAERDLNSTEWTPDRVLKQDEVILYVEVVHAIAPRDLVERQSCGATTSYVTDRTERPVNWDVQMSPVVIGGGRSGIDVSVASAFSISNGVSVSAGLDVTAVKDRLRASFDINYSRTWITQATVTVRGTVHAGETGVVITRPWTNRRYGRQSRGCFGSMQQTGTWMADAHEEGSYEGARWVAEAITMRIKRQRGILLSRCNGGGNFW
ncbi:hypothetical protein FGADI_7975 [Fusarium gaditjirri]|uniref:Uncharacterized protein n=1 Tax=Fusarium gaditjirri TaxID=282569 RepID=A0A8H4WUY7_9HYPO|nr:hypothetical protein FGADI_7975 [Fusarium gaditjirri]